MNQSSYNSFAYFPLKFHNFCLLIKLKWFQNIMCKKNENIHCNVELLLLSNAHSKYLFDSEQPSVFFVL